MAGDPAAYAAKPSQLANPVPGAEQKSALDSFMAEQKTPQVAPAAAPQSSALDSFMAQQGTASEPVAPEQAAQPAAQGAPLPAAPGQDPSAPVGAQLGDMWNHMHAMFTLPRKEMVNRIRESIASGNAPSDNKWLAATVLNNTIAMPEQLKNFKMASLVNEGANDKEKMSVLEKQVGKENVQVDSDGSLNFRYPGETEFRPLAPKGFEIFNDTIGNTRQVGKEAVLFPAEAMAAWASGGNPLVVTGVRAAGQSIANYAMDKVSEMDAGVTHDAERSRLVENLMDTGIEAASGILIHKVAQMIPGTNAAEKLQARKAVNEVTLTQNAKDLLADEQHLSSSGIFQSVPGSVAGPEFADQEIKFRADQIFTNDAKTQRATQVVKDSPQFQNVQQAQVDNVVNMTKTLAAKISQYSGNDAHAVVENLGSIVSGIDQAEGKVIGGFKAKAMAELGNEKLPVPEQLHQQAANMMQELGFTVKTQEVKSILRPASVRPGVTGVNMPNVTQKLVYMPPADMKPLMGKLGITSMGDMRSFVNALSDYANTGGTGLRISEIDRLTNVIGNLNPAAGRAGGQVKAAWGEFSGTLRQFRRDAIKAGLGNDIDARGFDAAMDKFGNLRQASDTLSRVLDGDFTSNAVVQQVFSKGQAGLENLKAVKALVKDSSPETWSALKQAWTDDMFRRYSTPGAAVPFNCAGMQKELGSYGQTFLREAFDGTGVTPKDVQALMNVAQNIQTNYKYAGAPAGIDEKTKQGLANAVFGAVSGMHFKTMNGLQQALGVNMPGNPLRDVLDPKELATRLAKYNAPPGTKAQIERNVKQLIATVRASAILPQALQQANFGVRNMAKLAARRAVAPGGSTAPEPEVADEP